MSDIFDTLPAIAEGVALDLFTAFGAQLGRMLRAGVIAAAFALSIVLLRRLARGDFTA